MNRRRLHSLRLKREDTASFEAKLREFHASKKTPFLRAPVVLGRRLDFLRLYRVVASLGGYRKVSEGQRWNLVLRSIGLLERCCNAEQAIRQLYKRFLEPYERWLIGDDKDTKEDGFEEADSSRMRRSLADSGSQVYNLEQHLLPPHLREQWQLSTELVEIEEYQLLERALLCGLPNEVDFAINTCLLLSHQQGGLQLSRNVRLIELLVAHAGVFDHKGSRSYYSLQEDWRQCSGTNMLRFWHESVWDEHLRCLLNPDSLEDEESLQQQRASPASGAWRLFNLTPDLSLRDAEGQRAVLVATSLRNLVMDDGCNSPVVSRCNAAVVSRSPPALRFLLLCFATRHSQLRNLAADCLSVLPLVLHSRSLQRIMLLLLCRCCCDGQDRQLLVRGLELLGSLAAQEANARWLQDSVPDSLLNSLGRCLLLKDLQLLVASLDAAYRLSALDAQCAARLASASSLLPMLISLLTFEASQVGSQGIVGIKIFQGSSTSEEAMPPPPPPQWNSLQTSAKLQQQQQQQKKEDSEVARQWLHANFTFAECGGSTSHCISQDEIFAEFCSAFPASTLLQTDLQSIITDELSAGKGNSSSSVRIVRRKQQDVNSAKCNGIGNQLQSQQEAANHEAVMERVITRCVNRIDKRQQHQQQQQQQQQKHELVNGNGRCLPPVANGEQQGILLRIVPKPAPLGLLCEWDRCWHCCSTAAGVLYHVYHAHLKDTDAAGCRWQGCDPSARGPMSLLSHVQERHCSEEALQASLRRRRQAALAQPTQEEAPETMQPLAHDAARKAIARLCAPSGPECQREGPVTRHIRLTAALTLRNLVRNCPAARGFALGHAELLAEISLSGSEAAPAVSHCLSELVSSS